MTHLAVLGGDHHNTVCTSGTVDGGGGSVLQNLDALDVGGVDEVGVVAHLHTVHDIKRRGVAIDGTHTTDADGRLAVRSTVLLGDHHTSCRALEGHGDVGRHPLHHGFLVDSGHGTGDVALPHGTITNDHDILEHGVVVLQDDLEVVPSIHSNTLRKISHIGDIKCCIRGSLHGELTVVVGDYTSVATLHPYGSPNDWFPRCISHRSFDGALRQCSHWEQTKQEQQH